MQVLYTGPMYKIYNMILRQHPEREYESFESNGNLFSTTLHALISAVSKIAQVRSPAYDSDPQEETRVLSWRPSSLDPPEISCRLSRAGGPKAVDRTAGSDSRPFHPTQAS